MKSGQKPLLVVRRRDRAADASCASTPSAVQAEQLHTKLSRVLLMYAHQIGDDLLDLVICQMGIWHAIGLIQTTMGGVEKICQPFRCEIFALEDSCKRRSWRMLNWQGSLVRRRNVADRTQFGGQAMALAYILRIDSVLAPGQAGRKHTNEQ